MLIPLGKGKFSRLRPSPTHCFWLWWIVCFLYFLFISLFISWFCSDGLFDILLFVYFLVYCLFGGLASSPHYDPLTSVGSTWSLLMPKLHFPGNTSNNFFGRYTWLSISRFLPFFIWVCESVCLCRCVCVSVFEAVQVEVLPPALHLSLAWGRHCNPGPTNHFQCYEYFLISFKPSIVLKYFL